MRVNKHSLVEMVWLGGGKGFFFPLLELISMGASLQSLSEEVCGPKGCLFFFLFCVVLFVFLGWKAV